MEPQRNTIQRALVLATVKKLKCHPTVDDIYQDIIKNQPSISRATVYRNLSQLAEAGEIRKMEAPSGPDRFDDYCENHYHVRCTKCQHVFDVEMDYIPDLKNKIKDNHGFQIGEHNIIFAGICPKCLSQEK